MSKRKAIGGAAATGGVLLAACAACCAPLIAAPVVAFFAVSGAGIALAGQIGLAVLLLAGGSVYVWTRQRRRSKASACSCGPTTSCNTSPKRSAITGPTS